MNARTLLAFASVAWLATSGIGLSTVATAQEPTVLLLEKVSIDERSDLPRTGMRMSQVREAYGEPQQEQGPVGDPPITTWRYADFSVYFEHDHVINSVRHFRRSDED